MGGLSIWHWLIVGVIVMLLFGKGRFSDMMGDMAKGLKAFKKGMSDDEAPTMSDTKPAPRLQAGAPIEPNPEQRLQPMQDDRPAQ